MQQVRFRNIDEFLEYLPEDERRVVAFLRQLVYDCIPQVQEKLSYNVPFFRVHKQICYIWPSSILWGSRKTYEGVRLGIVKGHLLQDALHYFEKGERKHVVCRDFHSTAEIDRELLSSYILEAALIDQELYLSEQDQQPGKPRLRPDRPGTHF